MSNWFAFHSWIMACVYPAVNILLFCAALSAARHPAFRRAFLCLACAAGLTLLCSAVTLLFRLHLNFSFSFLTQPLRRGLLIGQSLAEIASITIYCIGFVALVQGVRSLPRIPQDV